MKTKKLIELLQKEDPTGETECCIGNEDIFYVSVEPAYWDGTLQVLIRDEDNKYYNVIGAKYIDSGNKIVIRTLSINDAISEDTNLPVDYSNLGSAERKNRYKTADDKTRKQMMDIRYENELSHFLQWAVKKSIEISGEQVGVKEMGKDFFDKHYSYDMSFPPEIAAMIYNISYNDKRNLQYDKEVELTFDGMDWHFRKVN